MSMQRRLLVLLLIVVSVALLYPGYPASDDADGYPGKIYGG